jgi:hypothetical protein
MKQTAEMRSGAMLYIRSFINSGSVIQKLIMGDTQAHRQHGVRISFYFFQNEANRLNMIYKRAEHDVKQIEHRETENPLLFYPPVNQKPVSMEIFKQHRIFKTIRCNHKCFPFNFPVGDRASTSKGKFTNY